MSKNLREESRVQYITRADLATSDELKLGAILRIADATEAMAKNYVGLQNDRDWYRNAYENQCARTDELQRRINALKGVITKMKARAKPEHGEG